MADTTERLLGPSRWRYLAVLALGVALLLIPPLSIFGFFLIFGALTYAVVNRGKAYLDLDGDQLIVSNRKETHHLSRSGLVAECKVVDGNVGGPIAREGTVSGHAETRADNAVDPRRRRALLVTTGDGEVIEVEAAWGRTPKKIGQIADRINQAA